MTIENTIVVTLPNENLSTEEFLGNLNRLLTNGEFLKASVSVTTLKDNGEAEHLQFDIDHESDLVMNHGVSVVGTAATSVYRNITESTKLTTACNELDATAVLVGATKINLRGE